MDSEDFMMKLKKKRGGSLADDRYLELQALENTIP